MTDRSNIIHLPVVPRATANREVTDPWPHEPFGFADALLALALGDNTHFDRCLESRTAPIDRMAPPGR